MSRQFGKLALAAALALGTGVAGAAEYNWDLANEYQASSIFGEGDAVFAEKLAELSGGRIKVTLHMGGALGYKSVDHFDAVGELRDLLGEERVSLAEDGRGLVLVREVPVVVGGLRGAGAGRERSEQRELGKRAVARYREMSEAQQKGLKERAKKGVKDPDRKEVTAKIESRFRRTLGAAITACMGDVSLTDPPNKAALAMMGRIDALFHKRPRLGLHDGITKETLEQHWLDINDAGDY